MATSVRAIRLVTADGRTLDVGNDHDWFPHLGVSLGVLGVVSAVTFECVDRFNLELETRVVSLDRYLLEYERQNNGNEYYSATWIPAADSVITYAANRTAAPAGLVRRRERFRFITLLLTALSRYWNVRPFVTDRRFREFVVGSSAEILTPIGLSPRLANAVWRLARNVRAVEFAVPAESAAGTVAELDALLRRHPGSLANVIGLRATARDSFALSPCYRRECFWIDMFFHDGERFVSALRELFERFRARCHWGKHVMLPPGYLRRQYPQWDTFAELRARLDPTGVFANDFTERFGLVSPSGVRPFATERQ